MKKYTKVFVVGAGMFGSVVAERIANDSGIPVTVLDKRAHIGGNCWSEICPVTGIEYHKYGSHIFHTSDAVVYEYISKFMSLNSYRHTVYTTYQGRVYSMHINLDTINTYYGVNLGPEEARKFIAGEIDRDTIADPQNLEDKAVSLIGRPLYEAFIKGYTQKQWECPPRELPAYIITRLPVRYSYNNRYFSDTYEGVPVEGYAHFFHSLLKNYRISLCLNTNFSLSDEIEDDTLIVFTGPIDEYFSHRLGRLEWRTLDFEYDILDTQDYQGTAVMNYADVETKYTRVHEFKHYHPERPPVPSTLICREYSRYAGAGDTPYYPINTEKNQALYKAYRELAAAQQGVVFGGRRGSYKYLDMDDAVKAALVCYDQEIKPRLAKR